MCNFEIRGARPVTNIVFPVSNLRVWEVLEVAVEADADADGVVLAAAAAADAFVSIEVDDFWAGAFPSLLMWSISSLVATETLSPFSAVFSVSESLLGEASMTLPVDAMVKETKNNVGRARKS